MIYGNSDEALFDVTQYVSKKIYNEQIQLEIELEEKVVEILRSKGWTCIPPNVELVAPDPKPTCGIRNARTGWVCDLPLDGHGNVTSLFGPYINGRHRTMIDGEAYGWRA